MRSGRRGFAAAVAAVLAAVVFAGPAPAWAGTLHAGAGRADITPRTGHYLGGWTRADRLGSGQHTRLFTTAIVLERDGRKVALVASDLFMIPGGMLQQAAEMLRRRGFDERNVLLSVSHTHGGPGGFANSDTYNTAAPSIETVTDPSSFVELLQPLPADPQLYTFLTKRIASAIRRADRDLGPAEAGWGKGRLTGVTRNRSVEAHLADHGIIREFGEGSAREDPKGEVHTIDPSVDVLRVDKLVGGGSDPDRVPIGGWSNFANHGTVTKAEIQVYNNDHHASANHLFEQRVRRAGGARARQEVVNVYGNSNEGDQSAGLDHTGPAGSDAVGRAEGRAMFRAWRRAGRRMSRRPDLDLRWTRVCFCGQRTENGRVSSTPVPGLPFLTGSEEQRGPLFDVTGVPFEGVRAPTAGFDSQGHKVGITGAGSDIPRAAPLMVVRVADRLIASLPGEPTKEVGARLRRAVLAASRRAGIRRVVPAGLANEFLSYITTPEEYDRQHYEGGSTMYGQYQSEFLIESQAELAERLARGRRAPAPYDFDPTYGIEPDAPAYPRGAASGALLAQPDPVAGRLAHPAIAWQGGELGYDRPLDEPFVSAQRRTASGWRTVDSDLGVATLWRVSDEGRYDAYWEPPLDARTGTHRLVVTANRYRLASRPFELRPARTLAPRVVRETGRRVFVRLDYPEPVENVDLTARPASARGGEVTFTVGGRERTVRSRRGRVFGVRAGPGEEVSIASGAAADRFGNSNGEALTVDRDGRG